LRGAFERFGGFFLFDFLKKLGAPNAKPGFSFFFGAGRRFGRANGEARAANFASSRAGPN